MSEYKCQAYRSPYGQIATQCAGVMRHKGKVLECDYCHRQAARD